MIHLLKVLKKEFDIDSIEYVESYPGMNIKCKFDENGIIQTNKYKEPISESEREYIGIRISENRTYTDNSSDSDSEAEKITETLYTNHKYIPKKKGNIEKTKPIKKT